jgi:hypothetical protein
MSKDETVVRGKDATKRLDDLFAHTARVKAEFEARLKQHPNHVSIYHMGTIHQFSFLPNHQLSALANRGPDVCERVLRNAYLLVRPNGDKLQPWYLLRTRQDYSHTILDRRYVELVFTDAYEIDPTMSALRRIGRIDQLQPLIDSRSTSYYWYWTKETLGWAHMTREMELFGSFRLDVGPHGASALIEAKNDMSRRDAQQMSLGDK